MFREGEQGMATDYILARDFLACAASEVRLQIMRDIASSEKCVAEICESLDMGQSAVSQHLRKLREANLVITRRDKVEIYYRLAPGPASHLLVFLEDYFPKRRARPSQMIGGESF